MIKDSLAPNMDTNDARESSGQKKDGVKSPLDELLTIASEQGYELEDLEFSRYMDKHDPLANLRNEFYYPKMKDLDSVDMSLVDQEDDCVYFCGSSFGLCPKKTMLYMNEEIEKWQRSGYKGFITGTLPWAICDECLQDDMGKLVGAREGECALMNGLTVNLHLFLISFYNPTPARHKILIEANTFSSDRYVMESQIRLRGYDPTTALLILKPRQGEYVLRNEDILSVIEEKGESIATICLSGVQFYTGQKFNISAITQAGHKKGCYVGWDLAHAAGNVELFLHDWDVDFACWCTNKYLNCGPGSLGGVFLHEKHFQSNLPQLQGWWGHNIKTRFDTDTCFDPCHGALRYRLSTTPGFLCPPIKASLEVFGKTTVSALAMKSRLLTTYLEERILQKFGCRESASTNNPNAKANNSQRTFRKVGLDESTKAQIEIITPTDSDHRGAQMSLLLSTDTSVVHDELKKRGVLCDERKPNVLRVTPAPIYCSFEDVHRFVKYLGEALDVAKETRK